jgi:O-antigen ligase
MARGVQVCAGFAPASATSFRMGSDAKDRIVDFVIAGTLAVLPLLPAGPAYLDLRWPWALEAVFLLVAALGVAFLATHRLPADAASARGGESVRLVRRGYVTWLIPVAAATLIGLLERNPLDIALFSVETDDLIGRLAQPMHQAADTLYPLRVGATYLEGGLAFWLLSAALRRTSQPDRRIAAATHGCLVGVALVSVIALVQYATRSHLLPYWVRANPGLTRAHATLDDPNALASFLVLSIGLAAGVAWSARPAQPAQQRWADWGLVALLTTALACGALVTTVSRAGWLALAMAGIVCAVSLPERLFSASAQARSVRLAARGAVLLLIGAVSLWAVALVFTPKQSGSGLPATPVQALVQTVDPRESLDTVLKGRLLLWQAALDFAGANWPLGAGVGQFPRLYRGYPGSAGAENAHNYFLQVLAESGVVGLAGLTVLLTTIVLALRFRSPERGLRQGRLAAGLSVGLLAFVLTWLTGHPMLNLSNQLWLACVLAVGLAALEPHESAARAVGQGSESLEGV